MSRRSMLGSLAVATGLALAAPSHAATCESLGDLKLPDTMIVSAEEMPAGGFEALGAFRSADLPAACRVVAMVKAAPDSSVGLEMWLPKAGWEGVFHGNGNGGFGGDFTGGYPAMTTGLKRGYATAVTDAGTAPATPLNGEALAGHPRKWRDWGRLSTHQMTVTGKAIAQAYYRRPVTRSYYSGCSTGGQEGLIEALYYPNDYDGILVGAPVINRTWGHAAVVVSGLAANLQPGHALPDAKLRLLNAAVLESCGGLGSGLAGDPFLGDPKACTFDPAVLTCKGADDGACLTANQVKTARAFYTGPTGQRGRPLFFGWPRGSEAPGTFGWNFLQTLPDGKPPFASLFNWIFGPGWDWRGFKVERDMKTVDARLGPIVNDATRGSLRAFRARGGKLIIYHGWADSLVPPDQTIAFYERAARDAGGMAKAQTFARLFMAPGLMHCGGGSGPDAFNSASGMPRPPSATPQDDLFAALEDWVGQGAAPDQVIATRYKEGGPAKGVAMQRPLCPYPAKAWYLGHGDKNDAANFRCAVAKPKARP